MYICIYIYILHIYIYNVSTHGRASHTGDAIGLMYSSVSVGVVQAHAENSVMLFCIAACNSLQPSYHTSVVPFLCLFLFFLSLFPRISRVIFVTRRDPSARRQRHSDSLSVDSRGPVVGFHHHHYGAPTIDVQQGIFLAGTD